MKLNRVIREELRLNEEKRYWCTCPGFDGPQNCYHSCKSGNCCTGGVATDPPSKTTGGNPYTNVKPNEGPKKKKKLKKEVRIKPQAEPQINERIREELNRLEDMDYHNTPDISRDEIIEILNEIYELQLDKAPAIAQRRLEELFEKIGIDYWSHPSPDKERY
tara:strand:+ start:81 stop:566 length:486 start_codon:yes stop_codon:yes gene_type:complete